MRHPLARAWVPEPRQRFNTQIVSTGPRYEIRPVPPIQGFALGECISPEQLAKLLALRKECSGGG